MAKQRRKIVTAGRYCRAVQYTMITDIEQYGLYSVEDDDYKIPAGWWENRHFTPDDVYNNPVDCAVTHWMPLPWRLVC